MSAYPCAPAPSLHLALCGQPAGTQVQLLVGLSKPLALHLQLCPLQLQPRQPAPQLPTFTLQLTPLPGHLCQQLLSPVVAKRAALRGDLPPRLLLWPRSVLGRGKAGPHGDSD